MWRWRVLVVALILLLTAGQPVLAQGSEGGRVVFGGDFTLNAGEHLYGDLVVFGGNVVLERDSAVHGAVVTFGGSVRVAGRVDEDVVAFGGRVVLDETATVAGNVVATGGAVSDARAVVGGKIVGGARSGRGPLDLWRLPGPGWALWPRGLEAIGELFLWALQTVVTVLATVAVGALVMLLIPDLARTASRVLVEYPVASVGAGLLTAVVAALVLPLLVLTCIGIPLAVAGALALAIAGLFGWIVAGLALGERLLAALQQSRPQPLVAVVVGLAILTTLSRAPGLGVLVGALVGAWGLGAVLLSRFGTAPYDGRFPGTTAPRPSPPAPVADPDAR